MTDKLPIPVSKRLDFNNETAFFSAVPVEKREQFARLDVAKRLSALIVEVAAEFPAADVGQLIAASDSAFLMATQLTRAVAMGRPT
jgi:hypothetical protein